MAWMSMQTSIMQDKLYGFLWETHNILCTGPLLISHECLALVCKTCKWILPIGATNNSAKQLNFCSTLTCIHPLSQWKIVSDVCVHRVHSFMYIHSVREAPYQAFKPPEQELLQPLNYSEKVFSIHVDADVSVTREPSDEGIALKVMR